MLEDDNKRFLICLSCQFIQHGFHGFVIWLSRDWLQTINTRYRGLGRELHVQGGWYTHVYLISYSSPFIFKFYPSLGLILLCIPSAICIHSTPQIFAPFLTHHTYWSYDFFPSLLQCLVPSHNSVPLPLSHLHSIHIPHSHNHSIYNTIQSFPFTGTPNTAPFPSPSPSTLTSNSLHQLHWIPKPMIKNEQKAIWPSKASVI